MSGGCFGGGLDRGSVKNKKTYVGDDAGQASGWIENLLGIYGKGQQQANAQNDLLFGGKKYGSAKQYYGPALPDGETPPNRPGGAGTPAEAPGTTSNSMVDVDEDIEGDPTLGGGGAPPPGGQTSPPGSGAPRGGVDMRGGSGNEAPDGGLVGTYEDWENNPWQTGPGGDAETDNLGQYDWMASGMRNNDENSVYKRTGESANQWDASGQRTGIDDAREDIYGEIGGGPNENERSTYSDTSKYGSTPGEDVSAASGAYHGMVDHGGYDQATKDAMTQETMMAARSPFDRTREDIQRQGAARGNPQGNVGAQIALARDESNALGSAANKNIISQAQEAIRQKEAGAAGLQGTQGITNAAKQYSLSQRAGQNAQQAGQRLQGAAGLGDVQGQMTGRQQAALTGKGRTLDQQAAQNQAQRDTALKGTQGKQSMFDTMFARKQAGTAGKQGLYNQGQQQRAGDLAGIGNVGGKTREDYVESGNSGGSL